MIIITVAISPIIFVTIIKNYQKILSLNEKCLTAQFIDLLKINDVNV